MCVVSIDRPVNPIHFRRLKQNLKDPGLLNDFEQLNNFSCVLTGSRGHWRQKFDTVLYFSVVDSIAGDVLPLSCFKKKFIYTF